MALKHFNPTSPGRRQLVLVDRSGLHKGGPLKALTEGLNKTGGRNNLGRATGRHHWRRREAELPHHRLQAPQVGHARDDRASGV